MDCACSPSDWSAGASLVWPQAASGSVSLSGAQPPMLLEGIDWWRPERTWQPSQAA